MKGHGTTSLILGILGIFPFIFVPFIGIILSTLSLVFGIIQKKKYPARRSTVGIILGAIGIALNVLFLILMIVYFFSASAIIASPPSF